jgi:hypothetical protein
MVHVAWRWTYVAANKRRRAMPVRNFGIGRHRIDLLD